jgi:hypothetical protein
MSARRVVAMGAIIGAPAWRAPTQFTPIGPIAVPGIDESITLRLQLVSSTNTNFTTLKD